MINYYEYKSINLQEKIEEQTQRAIELTGKNRQKATAQLKKTNAMYKSNMKKLKIKTEKASIIAGFIARNNGKDFASQAGLETQAFDTSKKIKNPKDYDAIETLGESLSKSDVSLLNPKTKSFLKEQLNIDLEKLETTPKFTRRGERKDSKTKEIENSISTFLTFDDADLSSLIKQK